MAQTHAKHRNAIKHKQHAKDRRFVFVDYDADARAIRVAFENAERAGLLGLVHFERRPLSEGIRERDASRPNHGLVVVNPPYGERLGADEDLAPLYEAIGDRFKKEFTGWRGAILSGNPELSKKIGLRPERRHPVWNGPIECRLLTYPLYSGSS